MKHAITNNTVKNKACQHCKHLSRNLVIVRVRPMSTMYNNGRKKKRSEEKHNQSRGREEGGDKGGVGDRQGLTSVQPRDSSHGSFKS